MELKECFYPNYLCSRMAQMKRGMPTPMTDYATVQKWNGSETCIRCAEAGLFGHLLLLTSSHVFEFGVWAVFLKFHSIPIMAMTWWNLSARNWPKLGILSIGQSFYQKCAQNLGCHIICFTPLESGVKQDRKSIWAHRLNCHVNPNLSIRPWEEGAGERLCKSMSKF